MKTKIYDPLGRTIHKLAGFDNRYVFEPEQNTVQNSKSTVDLIGPEISYYSETEERWINRVEERKQSK